ncbi:MAG: helix-turn-helix domain-containing protein [Planctomycetes bacterium]|nr:helix-turn-helix domain-containing protein [Planctomycetota bacterium]
MAEQQQAANRVRAYRQSRGWTQAELALRAGISRAAVSAIEVSRLLPSVAAALSLARAIGCTVEDLFGLPAQAPGEPEWAWPPQPTSFRCWRATVRGRLWYYPVEALPAGVLPHDGVFQDGAFASTGDADPQTTLVLACCDPAVNLLTAEYGRSTGFRLLALPRSSRQALALLGQGLVHVAGVHFATREEPDCNRRAVQDTLGADYCLLRVAHWQEGLALGPGVSVSTIRSATRARLRWVGREPGSAARQCLDQLLPNRPAPRRLAHDHRGVAEALRCGWADIGVCHRLVCEEAGLRFLFIREEGFDLCFPASEEGDPRIDALLRVVRSSSYRRVLGELPGYGTAQGGELQPIR